MRAAVWVVVAVLATMWTIAPAAYLLGHRLGLYKGFDEREELTREWRRLFEQLGVEHAAAIGKLEGELADADRIRNRHMELAFRAGQVFQAERKDADL